METLEVDRRKLSALLKRLQGEKSAAWLARQMGIDGQRLRAYLRCDHDAGMDALLRIAAYMGISLDELTQTICIDSANTSSSVNVFSDNELYRLLDQIPDSQIIKAAKYLIDLAIDKKLGT